MRTLKLIVIPLKTSKVNAWRSAWTYGTPEISSSGHAEEQVCLCIVSPILCKLHQNRTGYWRGLGCNIDIACRRNCLNATEKSNIHIQMVFILSLNCMMVISACDFIINGSRTFTSFISYIARRHDHSPCRDAVRSLFRQCSIGFRFNRKGSSETSTTLTRSSTPSSGNFPE